MNKTEYPNRDALIEALRVYVKTMYPFIRRCLGEQEIKEFLRLPSDSNIEEKIEVKDISRIINERDYWRDYFQEKFKIIDRDDIRYYDARSVTRLIMMGRNQVSHDELRELDPEFTRTQLFLITELLGKVNRPDKQREVAVIRDELFSDDTAERLVDAEELLEDVERENAGYKKSLVEVEKHLETAKLENIKYEKDNTVLAEQVDEKEKHRRKLSKQLKNAKGENDKYKKNLAGIKQRLEKSEAARTDYKQRLETISKELKVTKEEARTFEENLKTTSNQLKEALDEWMASMESLTTTRKLFTAATIGNQEIQKMFPSFETDSAVRILDRRGTDKRTYLLELLEQKQPTIIYVQSEEMVETLLDHIVPEKADFIEKHGEQTSEAEEMEILEKLDGGELIAVVSDTTFSTLKLAHCVEHFVLCHLVPGSDAFFNRCQPAFTSANNACLHFIYESKQNVEDLAEKYPNEETLRKLYQKFRDRTPINTEFINPDNLCNELCKENELDITNLGIETGFSIFEELGFLEQNEEGIRRLSTPPRKLEESKIYCRGKKLKEEIANSPAFQHEHSIEQIWEKMLEELNIDSNQILRENSAHKIPLRISETERDYLKDSQTQPEQPTEVVEIDNAASDETATHHTPKPSRANAKVTEEQVREIRSRNAAGESYSKLAKEFGLTPTGIRNIVLRNTWKDVE